MLLNQFNSRLHCIRHAWFFKLLEARQMQHLKYLGLCSHSWCCSQIKPRPIYDLSQRQYLWVNISQMNNLHFLNSFGDKNGHK